MDMRYVKYLDPDEKYYTLPNNKNELSKLVIKDLPSSYILEEGEHWTNIYNPSTTIPIQGWKIHISTTIKEAQQTLDIVSKELLSRNINFKFVKSLWELTLKNSKYGDRASSGKFITIYPKDNSEFVLLLNLLENILKNSSQGPYILNDKRWKDSNVFFRYGAFAPMYYFEGGEKVAAISDPDGNFIRDARDPFYSVPPFIKELPEIVEMDNLYNNEIIEKTPLDELEIINSIHFSNGGGVYLVKDKHNKELILKEGRPEAGLDGQGRDAYQRLKNESKILNILSNTKYPVKIYDTFNAWEHKFILEEYIKGTSLFTWIATNYPFYSDIENKDYLNTSLKIINQIRDAIVEIHASGVGMGDLQPSNIIVQDDSSIRLIDFETASESKDSIHSGLMTPGFSGDTNMTRIQADWFALLRIVRNIFLPIGPVQDLSNNMIEVHDRIIYKFFGQQAIDLIQEIQNKCDELGCKPLKDFIESTGKAVNTNDINEMIEKVGKGIVRDLKKQKRLSAGDIRQFELEGGIFNVLNGGFGVAMALNRTNMTNELIFEWIESLDNQEIKQMSPGLFTGKLGVATVLYEFGYQERALEIINSINIDEIQKMDDISLASGLSGMGLFYLGLYYEKKDIRIIKIIKIISNRLEHLMNANITLKAFDQDIITKGLMNGWSGVSLFYSSFYKLCNESKYLLLSVQALTKDLKYGEYAFGGLYQLNDTFRLVPYIGGGSAGVALAIMEYELLANSCKYEDEIEGVAKLTITKGFFSCGFFRGTSGIFSTANAIDLFRRDNKKTLSSKSIETLKLHLVETEEAIYVPGDYCYRFSTDIFSGSAGVLLNLYDYKTEQCYSWLPILNRHKVFSLGYKGGELNGKSVKTSKN